MDVKKWLRRGIPLALVILFCAICVLSLTTIIHMQGNARAVNYAGIIRGATQRLVKQEMNNAPNDELIRYLDGVLIELSTGQGENGLSALPDAEYQSLNTQMIDAWDALKLEIARVREGADDRRLYELSEEYFLLADRAVSAAENYSEHQVGSAKTALIALNVCFLLLAALFLLYERRQKRVETALNVAEQASRQKSAFLSRMSHEIRTPLNGIIGMVEIARMLPDDREKQADCLEKLEQSSRYLLALINDILDMSRIESGKMELEERVFDLEAVFAHIYGMLQQKAESDRIAFEFACGSLTDTVVIGDDVRLTQILVNLLSNALKFTPQGGRVTLEIRQLELSEQSLSLEFIVTDTGIGISEKSTERIFEPFEQAEAATARQYGGTGLGLAISSNLVKMMGGTISVASRPGEGSRFVVAITFARPSAEEAATFRAARSSVPERINERAFDLSCAQILLAEDNAINAEIATTILETHGASVKWARNGREAVDAFAASPESYTLILMDIQMPVMDGLEASRAIRGLGRQDKRAVPIIALSANAFAGDINAALESGMDGYLAKPIVTAKLLETVRQFL